MRHAHHVPGSYPARLRAWSAPGRMPAPRGGSARMPMVSAACRALSLARLAGQICVLLAIAVLMGAAGAALAEPVDVIRLEVGEGRLIRLSRPAAAVFVAEPRIADVQVPGPGLVHVFGRGTGTTTLQAVDERDLPVLRARIQVVHALGRLRELLARIAPDSSIEVNSFPGGLLLEGEVPDPRTAADVREMAKRFLGEGEKLVDRLVIATPTQVTLSVRVAEMSRDVLRLFGLNWNAALTPGDFVFGLASGRTLGAAGALSRLLLDTGEAGLAGAGLRNGDADIAGVLDALEREGLVSVLAEPTLTARSGETARFLAGGEFPVPVGVDNGDIRIEFKEFGVRLSFTPTVLDSGRIALTVQPEVSELTDNGAVRLQGITVPALATRRAETTVELADGQSLMIGGLISRSTRNSLEKFPGLGDLPVLGALFRSTRFRRSETELVIVVTPHLVRPVAPTALHVPQEHRRPASSFEELLGGLLDREVADAPKEPPLAGRYGFLWE